MSNLFWFLKQTVSGDANQFVWSCPFNVGLFVRKVVLLVWVEEENTLIVPKLLFQCIPWLSGCVETSGRVFPDVCVSVGRPLERHSSLSVPVTSIVASSDACWGRAAGETRSTMGAGMRQLSGG